MKRIGTVGDIGSGKSYVAKNFGYPVFNADKEVGKIYKNDKSIFRKLKKILPKYIHTFPIEKKEITNAVLANNVNLKKIIKIIHQEVRKKMNIFIKKNKKKKIIILDIPLLLEKKINKKDDILVFVKSNKSEILRRLKKRPNFNQKLFDKFKNLQLPLDYKKKNLTLLLRIILQKNLLNKTFRIY